jgi:hypothetical protein
MGKPPFKFRASKPVSAAKDETPLKLEFTGMDQLLAVYADAFLVTGTGGMFTLYFFQGQLPASFKGTLTQTEQLKTEQAKGVARIVVTPEGLHNLVKSMAQHVGLKVESIEEEAK